MSFLLELLNFILLLCLVVYLIVRDQSHTAVGRTLVQIGRVLACIFAVVAMAVGAGLLLGAVVDWVRDEHVSLEVFDIRLPTVGAVIGTGMGFLVAAVTTLVLLFVTRSRTPVTQTRATADEFPGKP